MNDVGRRTATDRPQVTVLVAAYNEAPVIGDVVRKALEAVPSGEVLVVDDGSTDGTDRTATEAGARVVRLPANERQGMCRAPRAAGGAGRRDRADRRRRSGRSVRDPALLEALRPGRRSGGRLAFHRPFRGRRHHAGEPLGQPVPDQRDQRCCSRLSLTDTQAGFKAVRARRARSA